MKKVKTTIAIKDIVIDEELYPRNNCNWQTAYDYSVSMKTGTKFPLITLAKYKNLFLLVDGRHRLEALKILLGKKAKEKKVKAEVLMNLAKNQIYKEAVKRNIGHGRQFSIQEKLQIAAKLKDLHYTTANISKLIQIPASKLILLQARKVTNTINGEEFVLKSEVVHLGGQTLRGLQNGIEYAQVRFKGNKQVNLLDELIVLIKTRTIDIKNKAIKGKIKILKTLLRKIKV